MLPCGSHLFSEVGEAGPVLVHPAGTTRTDPAGPGPGCPH